MKLNCEKSVTVVYQLKESPSLPASNRTAKIIIIDDRFVRCEFTTECIPYNLGDWKFLAQVSDKIKEVLRDEG